MDAVLYIYNVDILVHKMFGAKKILLKNDSYENEAIEAKSLLNISAFCVS